MKLIHRKSIRRFGPHVLAVICLLMFTAGISYGATKDYYLRVDAFQVPGTALVPGVFGNTAPITMWGFADCGTDATFTTCTAAVPGPALTAAEGDTLNIHVRNNLTGLLYTEPTSVIIPGQPGGNLTPTWTDGTTGPRTGLRQRVRSFTAETAVGGTTIYTWTNLEAGTYLYQSGTHPSVQVQMGLYGPLKVYSIAPVPPATSGRAYADPSSVFSSEVTLLFSEIDPLLHNAIATGTYGPGLAMTSTVDYHPTYFLINGKGSSGTPPTWPGGAPGTKLLIRFLNAGLDAKVPLVQGPYMSVIAEDGNFMTAVNTSGVVVAAPKQQYSVLLSAGKTMDAIMTTPATAGRIPVYDRRLNLTNGASSPGGMLTYIVTGVVSPLRQRR